MKLIHCNHCNEDTILGQKIVNFERLTGLFTLYPTLYTRILIDEQLNTFSCYNSQKNYSQHEI